MTAIPPPAPFTLSVPSPTTVRVPLEIVRPLLTVTVTPELMVIVMSDETVTLLSVTLDEYGVVENESAHALATVMQSSARIESNFFIIQV